MSTVSSAPEAEEDNAAWTEAELRQVRADLTAEVERLSEEIAVIEAELSGVVEDPIGADGRDEADVGGRLAEREHAV